VKAQDTVDGQFLKAMVGDQLKDWWEGLEEDQLVRVNKGGGWFPCKG